MAAVTSEILNNMLRTSLTDLKSFVGILNAVLAEEGQGDESRAAHKDDISRVLDSFGQCEAYLKKNSECLHKVEAKINDHFDEEAWDTVEEKALHDEIKQIIKMIGGTRQSNDDVRRSLDQSIDEDKISQHLEKVGDILNEYHPLRFAEDGEDDEETNEEEEQLSEQLEAMQKKAMSRLEKRMNSVGSPDAEEFASRLEEATDSEDDEEFDYDSLERVDNRRAEPNTQAKRNMDARLKTMWNKYKEELAKVQPLDTKQLFIETLTNQAQVNVQNLKYFSQFNDNIMELFTQEAPLIVGTRRTYVDPISKKKIRHPVRNTICDHIYERDTIYGILKKKKKMRCPMSGCSCSSFTREDLVQDDDVALKISRNVARQRKTVELDTEDMETEDEDSSNDSPDVSNDGEQIDVDTEDDTNTEDDTENADTQSQELL